MMSSIEPSEFRLTSSPRSAARLSEFDTKKPSAVYMVKDQNRKSCTGGIRSGDMWMT